MLIQVPIDAAPQVVQDLLADCEKKPEWVILPIGWNVKWFEQELPEYVI